MKGFASKHCGYPSSLHTSVKLGSLWWVVFSLAYLLAADAPVALMAARQAGDFVPVCAIQGNGDISPYSGQPVRTRGVIYADFETLPVHGFYLQHEACDGSVATSDGIFVYTGSGSDQVHSGDFVEVSGIIQEYHRQTEILPDPDGLAILSVGQSLPPALELDPPQDGVAAAAYLESLEGMHVRMSQANVVGPTSNDNQTWVVNASRGGRASLL